MAQGVGEHTAFAKGWDSVSSTSMGQLTMSHNSSSGRSNALFWPLRALQLHAQIDK